MLTSAIALTVSAVLPSAPVGLSALAFNEGLSVTWSAPSGADAGGEPPTGYRVRWRLKDADGSGSGTAPGAWQDADGASDDGVSLGSTALRYEIEGLDNDAVYEVQAASVNSAGAGAWSSSAEGTPLAVLALLTRAVRCWMVFL